MAMKKKTSCSHYIRKTNHVPDIKLYLPPQDIYRSIPKFTRYTPLPSGTPPRSLVVRASARAGVPEAGVRSPTVSHQGCKKWEVCASQLGA